MGGTTFQYSRMLHEKYGEVVRFTPNELSFISAESAWADIYGSRTGKFKGHSTMLKDSAWYAPPGGKGRSMFVANDEKHALIRKHYAPAFNERSLMAQEPLIQKYVDQLVTRLGEESPGPVSSFFALRYYL